jgi:hypothetical protein
VAKGHQGPSSQVKIEIDPVLGPWAIRYPDGPLSRRDQIRVSPRGGYLDPDRPFTRWYSWADAFDALERREREHAALAEWFAERLERLGNQLPEPAEIEVDQGRAPRRPLRPPRPDPVRTPLTTRGPNNALLRTGVPEGVGG